MELLYWISTKAALYPKKIDGSREISENLKFEVSRDQQVVWKVCMVAYKKCCYYILARRTFNSFRYLLLDNVWTQNLKKILWNLIP